MKILDVYLTLNPNSLKIEVDQVLVEGGALTQEDEHPLVRDLMDLAHVMDVYVEGASITIIFDPDKIKGEGLEELKQVAAIVKGFDYQGVSQKSRPVLEDPTLILIKEVLDEKIMPYLRSHGGSLELKRLEGDTLYIQYRGACGTCPVSTAGTLRNIENILRIEVDPNLKVALY